MKPLVRAFDEATYDDDVASNDVASDDDNATMCNSFLCTWCVSLCMAEEAQADGVDVLTAEDDHTGVNFLHRQVRLDFKMFAIWLAFSN